MLASFGIRQPDAKHDPMTTETLARRIFLASLAGLVVAAAFFAAFPGTDLAVSRLFGDASGFAMARMPFWINIRNAFIASTDGLMLFLLALLAVNALREIPLLLSCRQIGFALLAYALGPGLVANGIFKSFWGRARPRNIIEFGGNRLFTPPLLPADQCSHNCSFVSGEGSAVMTVALIAVLLMWPRLKPRGRILAIIGAAAFALSGSALRVAFGGHFLSDVVFAALMMGIVVPSAWLIVARRIVPV